jgi:hypothetical protein
MKLSNDLQLIIIQIASFFKVKLKVNYALFFQV